MSDPKRAAAVAALQAAVAAKLAYWDTMNALEGAFGFGPDNDIPDASSDALVHGVENLATCSDDVSWIGDAELDSIMTSAQVGL